MDSLSQIVLGGAVGEAVLGRKAGNKAVVWGAVAGTIPDLDVIAQFFMDPVRQADFHRGISHSLVFSLLVAPALGWMIARIHRKEGISVRSWTLLAFMGLVTHPLLDMFTTWGTEFFWPFSSAKIAFNSIFVVDPLYTLPFMTFLILAMRKHRKSPRRRILNYIGIAWSCLYLGLGLVQKARARSHFKAQFERQHIVPEQYMTRPSPFNTLHWGVVAKVDNGYWLGFHSLPGGAEEVKLTFFKDQMMPRELAEHPRVQDLLRISQGYLIAQPYEKGWLLSDLRYMTTEFHLDGDESFLFNYYFRPDGEGGYQIDLRQQAPEFNSETLTRFWNAIWGKA